MGEARLSLGVLAKTLPLSVPQFPRLPQLPASINGYNHSSPLWPAGSQVFRVLNLGSWADSGSPKPAPEACPALRYWSRWPLRVGTSLHSCDSEDLDWLFGAVLWPVPSKQRAMT